MSDGRCVTVRRARGSGHRYCAQRSYDARVRRNAERDREIRARIAAGESQRAVARVYGISPTRVQQILQEPS